MPRARLRHLGEPAAHGPAGVVMVAEPAVSTGQLGDSLGVVGTEGDAAAQHVAGGAQQVLSGDAEGVRLQRGVEVDRARSLAVDDVGAKGMTASPRGLPRFGRERCLCMRMGPITLFDKSFLEMLNVDEAALFDALYSAVICPIFYTEVLADLEKATPGSRTPEKVVQDIARKTPVMHSTPNMLHAAICLAELGGYPIDMRRVPVRAGGIPVNYGEKVGLIFDEAPELKAFDRWQRGRFQDIERDFASAWRAQLKAARHADMAKLAKAVLRISESPRNLEDALSIAKKVVAGDGQRYVTLKTAYALLGLPERLWKRTQERWKTAGGPPLDTYAPYTAYCLMVDTFFHVAVDKKLISPDRPSNRIDVAYLYYLPFCMAFVSNDKLHKRCAPLFLGDNQLFIEGSDLKRDLAALDAYYWALPEDQRREGLFRLASYPPNDDTYLTTRVWKKLKMATVRPQPAIPSDPSQARKILDMVKDLKGRAQRVSPGAYRHLDFADPDHLVVERRIPLQMGKWRTMPPGVEGTSED